MAIPSNLRAVVADDSDVTRHQVGQLLGKLGIEVIGYADDGVQAVQRCLQLGPDLLVSDLVMPRLTGVDVIRLVRTRLQAKIIVITSHCDKSMHARCLAMGANAVLIKPVSAEDLQQVLAPLWEPSHAPGLRGRPA